MVDARRSLIYKLRMTSAFLRSMTIVDPCNFAVGPEGMRVR
jgi:hypothetical protein